MKAIVYEKYGSPNVLKLKEIEKPTPKTDEVLVKVRASSINSWDWDLLTGRPLLARPMFGLLRPKRQIIGCDIAGIVEGVGVNVTKFKKGDEVFGDLSSGNWGGFAEFVCANENELLIKPTNISFEEAAAVPQAGLLALQSFLYHRKIQPEEKILINGAGGGVGTYGLQIAKLFDAEVTCVDKAEKLDILTSLGADHVIDYTKEDFTRNGQTYDRILDVIMNRSFFKYKRSLKTNGIYAVIGGKSHRIMQVALFGYLKTKYANKDGKKLGLVLHKANKGLDYLCELIQTGKLKSVIDKSFPLDETAEAFRHFERGNFRGKIVIIM